jgi:hypothetical protein
MRSWKPSALVAAAIAAMIAGCQAKAPEPEASTSAPPAAPAAEHPADQSLSLVIARHATELMGIPGVVGVYEGETEGRPVLRVMVVARADSTLKRIPKSLEGYDVEVEVGGPIKPMGH